MTSDKPKRPRRVFRMDSRVKVDPEDLERLRELRLSVYVANGGYAWFSTQATGPVAVHVFLMGRVGSGQDGFRVDHINGDRLDNRRANLRLVPDQVNQINRKRLNRNNKSGYRGVSYMRRTGKWRASISVNYRQVHLGSFSTAEEAFAARRTAELSYFPEPCPLPEPKEPDAVHSWSGADLQRKR